MFMSFLWKVFNGRHCFAQLVSAQVFLALIHMEKNMGKSWVFLPLSSFASHSVE